MRTKQPVLVNKTPEEFQKLINDNIKFPYFIVKKEYGKRVAEWQWEDLIAAANAGLVYAATKYDLSKSNKTKFITYAVPWVRYYINEQIKDFYPVRSNQNFMSKKNKIDSLVKKYASENNGDEPSNEWLAEQTGMSVAVVGNVRKIQSVDENGKLFSFLSIDYSDKDTAHASDKITVKCIDKMSGGVPAFGKVEMNRDLADILNVLKSKVTEDEYKMFIEHHIKGLSMTKLSKMKEYKSIKDKKEALMRCMNICREAAGVNIQNSSKNSDCSES